MNIVSILEIIEPRVQTKQWRGRFDPKKQMPTRKDRSLGVGNFADVEEIRNRPDIVRKTSSSVKAASLDGYWVFIDELVKQKLWKNPYFPRVHDVKIITDAEGQKMYRAKIEKLIPLEKLELENILKLFKKTFGVSFAEKAREAYQRAKSEGKNVSKPNLRKSKVLNEIGEMMENYLNQGNLVSFEYGFQIKEQNVDQQLIDALLKIHEISKKHNFGLDIHDENIMLRPGDFHMVITDPISQPS